MRKNVTRVLGIVLSLLMVLSVISFPTLKTKAAAGTIDDFVERCYTVTLDRHSEPEGFEYWKGQLLNGEAVGVHVAYGFLFSSEYTKKNKSPEDYVTDLYMLFMGREPDEKGYKDWVGQLKDGKSRVEVFAGFANSQEFYNICESYGITAGRFVVGYDRFQVNYVNLFVERLYKVCLNRIGDRDGQKNWVEKLVKKQITGSECARSFIQSQEYENLGLSDADYVENLYIALMGRASDAPGKADWLTKLANGMTRDEVFAGFVNSVEFDGICRKYNIDRGTYTATKKGTYDPNKQNNNNNNNSNNQNNNNNNNNNNSNNQYNDKTNYKVGDVILFGKYQQDADDDDEILSVKRDIEWEILSVEEGRILVISKYALDTKPYNNENKNVSWETCTLRKWLNNDFYNIAFSNEEKKKILSTTIDNKANSYYGTTGGNNTTDKVFCLSIEETEKHFGYYSFFDSKNKLGYNQKLICEPTAYAWLISPYGPYIETVDQEFNYNYITDYGYTTDVFGKYGCYWWLRDISQYSNQALCVSGRGEAGCYGLYVNSEDPAVRPAMYIEYKSNTVNTAHTHNYYLRNTDSKYLKSAATCTKAAEYYFSCECGKKDTSRTFLSGSYLGHDWDNGTVTKEATLTDKGIITYKCQRSGCNDTKTKETPCILESSKVGDIVKFGKYEQDGDTSNGKEDIEWQILSKEEGKVLVISKYALDSKQYHTSNEDVTWETSYLRSWLNQGFYKAAFSDSDKSKIQSVTIENKKNSLYGTAGGNNTTDKVFCLSIEELKKYFGDYYWYNSEKKFGYSQKYICTPTQYAIDRGAISSVITNTNYNDSLKDFGYTSDVIGCSVCNWWLRSPGSNSKCACFVGDWGFTGSFVNSGVNTGGYAVRPALYIKY